MGFQVTDDLPGPTGPTSNTLIFNRYTSDNWFCREKADGTWEWNPKIVEALISQLKVELQREIASQLEEVFK